MNFLQFLPQGLSNFDYSALIFYPIHNISFKIRIIVFQFQQSFEKKILKKCRFLNWFLYKFCTSINRFFGENIQLNGKNFR